MFTSDLPKIGENLNNFSSFFCHTLSNNYLPTIDFWAMLYTEAALLFHATALVFLRFFTVFVCSLCSLCNHNLIFRTFIASNNRLLPPLRRLLPSSWGFRSPSAPRCRATTRRTFRRWTRRNSTRALRPKFATRRLPSAGQFSATVRITDPMM